ncbi:MAG: hypothetical protein ABIJ31_14400, partial [Pseudomonadota bacterium]
MMITCDQINLIEYIEGLDTTGQTERHLESCEHCQEEYKTVKQLITILTNKKKKTNFLDEAFLFDDTILSDNPLPEKILTMVKDQKEKWKKGQAQKVVKNLGITDKQDNIIKLVTGNEPGAFLNAAFPDDL